MKIIYKGKIVTLQLKEIKFSDGHTSLYECVLHKPAVAVVPVIENNKILLIRQKRPVLNKLLWEIPAGLVEKNESVYKAAKREIEEETGLRPKKLFKLIEIYSSPGFTNEKTTIFWANKFIEGKIQRDKDEKIETKIFSFESIMEMIEKNQIIDAKTIIGILMIKNFFKKY